VNKDSTKCVLKDKYSVWEGEPLEFLHQAPPSCLQQAGEPLHRHGPRGQRLGGGDDVVNTVKEATSDPLVAAKHCGYRVKPDS